MVLLGGHVGVHGRGLRVGTHGHLSEIGRNVGGVKVIVLVRGKIFDVAVVRRGVTLVPGGRGFGMPHGRVLRGLHTAGRGEVGPEGALPETVLVGHARGGQRVNPRGLEECVGGGRGGVVGGREGGGGGGGGGLVCCWGRHSGLCFNGGHGCRDIPGGGSRGRSGFGHFFGPGGGCLATVGDGCGCGGGGRGNCARTVVVVVAVVIRILLPAFCSSVFEPNLKNKMK